MPSAFLKVDPPFPLHDRPPFRPFGFSKAESAYRVLIYDTFFVGSLSAHCSRGYLHWSTHDASPNSAPSETDSFSLESELSPSDSDIDGSVILGSAWCMMVWRDTHFGFGKAMRSAIEGLNPDSTNFTLDSKNCHFDGAESSIESGQTVN